MSCASARVRGLYAVVCCGALLLLLIALPPCSAAIHQMYRAPHPLLRAREEIEFDDGAAPKQYIFSVLGTRCDQLLQLCGASCALGDILPPHSCILRANSSAARHLLATGAAAAAADASISPPSVAHPLLQLRAPQHGQSAAMSVRCLPGTRMGTLEELKRRLFGICPFVELPRLDSESSVFSVMVSDFCYHLFLDAAAGISNVVSVFHREQFKIWNRWTHSLIQSRSRPLSPPPTDTLFWNENITGSGQTVAIGDTGVDSLLGFFYDPLSSVPYCQSCSSCCQNLPPHRRFKAYIQLQGGDKRDDDGHGSHTTASLAGNALCSDSSAQSDQQLYNGMAPDAKLVFSDISNDETLGGLPDDLASDYFPLPFSLGARVRSDSWGTSDAFYTESARDFDSFAFSHDEFLPLIAAGNDGDSGLFTVGAPATAKNCIAVGATGNALSSYLYLSDRDFGIRVEAPVSPSCAYNPPQPLVAAHPAGFGPKISDGQFQGVQIVPSSPIDACSPLVGGGYTGKLVLIVRGDCTFVEKVRAASIAGASGVIVFNNVGGIIRMGGSGDDITIPSMSIVQEMGKLLQCLMGASSAVTLTLPLPMPVTGDIGPEYVAAFSSLGPTMDGRLKPDLMAPGEYVFSAKANPVIGTTPPGYCAPLSANQPSIRPIQGTSMAAPTLAGAAVLLRQWLVEGRFPDGFPKQGPSAMFTSPSGALIKALLISSALPLTGNGVKPTPNIYEGYGAALLADAVPLVNTKTFSITRGRLWADERVTLPNTFSSYFVTVDIIDTALPLVATLVWWDAPVSIVAPNIIANDYDLTCFPPNGTSNVFGVYTGNGYSALSRFGVQHQVSDRVNTNERVYIRQPSKGSYVCVVTLERQLMIGSSFSIVITGGFLKSPISQVQQGSPCTGSCVHGRCSAASRRISSSACVCDIGWTGIICDIAVSMLSASSNSSVTLPLSQESWQYFWFIVPTLASSFRVTFSRLGSVGDPDFYVQQSVPPSVSSFVVHSTECDSCSPTPLPPAVLHVDSSRYQAPLEATISLSVSSEFCDTKGPDFVLGCDGSCVKRGGAIVDYDSCGICGGNGSTCFQPAASPSTTSPLPTPSPSYFPANSSAPESVEGQELPELKGGAIGAITVAVLYYVFSACVSLFVFYRVRGSARPVRLRITSFLWCLFGFTGAHRFYTKHTISGFIWLFTCGLCGIGWIVDIFLLRRMVARYNVHGSRMPKFFQGMQNRFKNRVGKSRYRKTINFDDDEISLDQSGGTELSSESSSNATEQGLKPKIFDGAVEVVNGGTAV